MSDAPERIWAWPHETPTYCSKRDPSSNRDAIEYRRADLPPTYEQIMDDPRVAALVEAVEDAIAANPTELNLGNYHHDDVCKLQEEAIDVWQILTAALSAIKEQKP